MERYSDAWVNILCAVPLHTTFDCKIYIRTSVYLFFSKTVWLRMLYKPTSTRASTPPTSICCIQLCETRLNSLADYSKLTYKGIEITRRRSMRKNQTQKNMKTFILFHFSFFCLFFLCVNLVCGAVHLYTQMCAVWDFMVQSHLRC